MLKQAVSANSGPSDVCPLGPLTQRLLAVKRRTSIMLVIRNRIFVVKALVDENPSYDVPEKLEEDVCIYVVMREILGIVSRFAAQGQASPLKVKSEQQKMTGRGGGRTFSIPHVASLEARLKEELAALGVIDEGETVRVGASREETSLKYSSIENSNSAY